MNDDISAKIDELEEKIDELNTLVKENHRMTKNLYQRARMATIVVFIKWFVIIGITLGSFYYIQPLINNLVGIYGGTGLPSLGNETKSTSSSTSGSTMSDLLNSLLSH